FPMKIVIVRHGDPDYAHHTLTERGFREAAVLGRHYSASDFDEIYSSPLNRAKLTAEAVVKGEKEIVVCDWLKECFRSTEVEGKPCYNWDFMPSYLRGNESYFDNSRYLDNEPLTRIDMRAYYDEIVSAFDRILEKNGYHRNGTCYDAVSPNRRTIAFFCHFGMMSVLSSHLTNLPYVAIAQGFFCPPTGVTTFVSEEREKGVAQFRCVEFGNTAHLSAEGMKPAFSGRFCELYHPDDRHEEI
ncbi:MAG: histidine phosphatase family protein, partial [Christensenellaceae bacterium]